MPDQTRVVLFGRGRGLSPELCGALGDVDLERISDEPIVDSMKELGARKPTVVILDGAGPTEDATLDKLRAVAPQAWFLDGAGIVRRRPEGCPAHRSVTKPFEL